MAAAMRRGGICLTTQARLQALADAQRELATALHAEVALATRDGGFTWEQVGDAIGIPRETAFRQFNGGTGIVVIRATQARRKGEQ